MRCGAIFLMGGELLPMVAILARRFTTGISSVTAWSMRCRVPMRGPGHGFVRSHLMRQFFVSARNNRVARQRSACALWLPQLLPCLPLTRPRAVPRLTIVGAWNPWVSFRSPQRSAFTVPRRTTIAVVVPSIIGGFPLRTWARWEQGPGNGESPTPSAGKWHVCIFCAGHGTEVLVRVECGC